MFFFGNINNAEMYIPVKKVLKMALMTSLKQKSRSGIPDQHLCIFLRFLNSRSYFPLLPLC